MNYLGGQKLCSQGNYRTDDRCVAFDAAQQLADMLGEPVAVCHGNGQYTTISHWSWEGNKFTKRYSGLAVISWLEPQVIA